jgi:NADPH:quinone reductase-like Zn-dependent oxidoreductase
MLVRVKAAGVNAMDPAMRAGFTKDWREHRFPLTPGSDYAGTVEAVGPGVQEFAVGDEVFGDIGKSFYGEGSFAELVAVDAKLAAKRPSQVSAIHASTLARAGGTAFAAVDALGAQPGDTIAVVGAGGGVGSYAVRLAVARGVRVIAATRPEQADYVRSLGASDVVDATAPDLADQLKALAPGGLAGIVDVFHDAASLEPLTAAVRDGGTISTPAAMGAEQAFAGQRVTARNVRAAVDHMAELGELAAAGKLDVRIEELPLEQTAEALDRMASNGTVGKLVIVVGGNGAR